ncbi:DUF2785 domain-containing protein [Paenibacillus pini]|uniref:DUF2785 domain-containing protein n=1 Tax=Paenibacillus pini JCM 16418 TaxID=1236976 RepID=W7YDK5_9BACL|nr:DUF2785 domain-containing protein [Paenibacillus pini]GAF06537.1 hypothetical protein JCM16418_496 [Paenibacillus pini JCM 16418]
MEHLKELLQEISNHDYQVPIGVSPVQVVHEMLLHIGSIDSELRDNLIYSTFYKWISNEILTIEQVRSVLEICLDDEHLFLGIGDTDSDTVFTRTFSVLIVPIVLSFNESVDFLSEDDIRTIFHKICLYYELEKDLRGYVPIKGWAHSAAHGADALKSLVNSNVLQEEDLLNVLELIRNKTAIYSYCYTDDEDDRMAVIVKAIVQRNILKDEQIIDWVESVRNYQSLGKYPEDMMILTNTKNLLRSVYFQLFNQVEGSVVANTLGNILKE